MKYDISKANNALVMSVHQVTECKIGNITFYRHLKLSTCSDESFNYGTAHPELFHRNQISRVLPNTHILILLSQLHRGPQEFLVLGNLEINNLIPSTFLQVRPISSFLIPLQKQGIGRCCTFDIRYQNYSIIYASTAEQ